MKKNKLFLATIILLCSLLAFVPVTAYEQSSDIVVNLQIDNPNMKINGVQTELDSGRGTKPIVLDGHTLVPIRAIIEAFNGHVTWNENTQTVTLSINNDTIRLTINSKIAYISDKKQTLDVAPEVINGRTMLPIRFIAEGLNLGVAWDDKTQTVSIISNTFDDNEYQMLKKELPAYSGNAYFQINNNTPYFKDYEIIPASFEYYSELDELDRCGVCFASISKDIMPTEERSSISSITPSGWKNISYDGKYLYNRCHLIGYQLTAENANEKNLITGTRYLNLSGMLPFENMVDNYIEETGNHVLYRSTPVFTGSNLVADGVLLEAYSVEDNGKGLCFCTYCYNIQPEVEINYSDGSSKLRTEYESTTENADSFVYCTPSGKRYHFDAQCGGKNSYPITLKEAIDAGLTPCSKCTDK